MNLFLQWLIFIEQLFSFSIIIICLWWKIIASFLHYIIVLKLSSLKWNSLFYLLDFDFRFGWLLILLSTIIMQVRNSLEKFLEFLIMSFFKMLYFLLQLLKLIITQIFWLPMRFLLLNQTILHFLTKIS